MPPRRESILDNGHWEKNKSDLDLAARVREPPLQAPSSHVEDGGKQVGSPSDVTAWAKWFLQFLRPALFGGPSGPPKPVRSTAYLDGLRGFAALMVYLGHHISWSHDLAPQGVVVEHGLGFAKLYYFCQVPGFRILFSGGHISVCIFFVISGYVLSAKPLQLIHAGDYAKLGENLGSALFRRWLRLFIPVFGTTFLFMTSWHAFGWWTDWPKHQPTYRQELWEWYAECKNFSFIFRGGGEPWLSYNFHAWSIPTEFKGSIVIYTVLMAVSRCSRNARLWCQIVLMWYFMYVVDGYYCALFIAGMMLCDLDLLARANDLPEVLTRMKPWKNFIFNNLFVAGIYLSGVPHVNRDIMLLRITPGWYYLSFLKPQAVYDYKWFYLFWAAIFIVSSLNHMSWLKRFFELTFNQYLGRISYAFYLVHGPVMWLLGDRLYAAVGWPRDSHAAGIPGWVGLYPLSKAGPYGLEFSFLACHVILFPLTLWVAELATKMFDEPSVQVAQWAYRKTLAPKQ